MSARVHSSAKRFTLFDQPKQLFRMRSIRTPLERTRNAMTNKRPTPNRTPPNSNAHTHCSKFAFRFSNSRHFRCDRATFTELNHAIRFDCTSSSSLVAIKEDDRSLRQHDERIRFVSVCVKRTQLSLPQLSSRCAGKCRVLLENFCFASHHCRPQRYCVARR